MNLIDLATNPPGKLVDVYTKDRIKFLVYQSKCRHYHLVQLVNGKMYNIKKRFGKTKAYRAMRMI